MMWKMKKMEFETTNEQKSTDTQQDPKQHSLVCLNSFYTKLRCKKTSVYFTFFTTTTANHNNQNNVDYYFI